jgi:nitroreductase
MKEKILEAFHFRHACKEFDAGRKITDEDFDFIMETARLSPSSFGFEPWKFLVVQNMELREKLRAHTWGGQNQFPTASHLVVILARKSHFMKYDSPYIEHMMADVHSIPEEGRTQRRQFYEKFQKSDSKLLESERAMFDWACRQTYIALGNMMTSAAMIGVDSCPIEGFVADEIEKVMSADFGINTDHYGVSCMLTLGYRKGEGRPKTRQSIEEIVEWFR